MYIPKYFFCILESDNSSPVTTQIGHNLANIGLNGSFHLNWFLHDIDLLWKVKSWEFQVPGAHLSTAVAQREKKFQHFVFNKYFSLVLGVLKSKIKKKSFEPLLRKLDFKLFHYKARVQPVSKITTIATRNRCWI